MKTAKKICMALILTLAITMVTPFAMPKSDLTIAQAATIKLTKTKMSLNVGKSYKLKISGTKSKVTWSSSNKAVATVSKYGTVTGKKAGKVTITATVNKKKYTCKVTVNKPVVNPFIEKAPFEAKEVTVGKISFVIPKVWGTVNESESSVTLYPESEDSLSSISVEVLQEGYEKSDFDLLRDEMEQTITEDFILESFTQSGFDAKVLNMDSSEYQLKSGPAFKLSYSINLTMDDNNITLTHIFYYVLIDHYVLGVSSVIEDSEGLNDEILSVSEYILDSAQIKK